VFAEVEDVNAITLPIVSRLISIAEANIQEFEEGDVLTLLKSYQYLDSAIPKSNRLFKKLNETVHELAKQNTAEVGSGFLTQYLSMFFDIPSNR
jgi:hypothetical protein